VAGKGIYRTDLTELGAIGATGLSKSDASPYYFRRREKK